MDLRAAASQLLMAGFDGEVPPSAWARMASSPPIGGVILFRRNIRSWAGTRRLTGYLQDLVWSGGGPGLLVAVDQEGGTVSRLPGDEASFPSAMAVGASGDPRLAAAAGEATGRRLSALGINVNMAPVLDVNTNPLNPVIGLRSFGDDPDLVSRMGTAYIRGLERAGVMAVAKHFPGHGHAGLDSHHHLPVVSRDRAGIEAVELAPFRAALRAGVRALMTAHVSYPALDPSGRPATLSGPIITGILRRGMGFCGLVFTDDMEMEAVAGMADLGLGAVDALAAGCDVILVSHHLDRQLAVRDSIVQAVTEGRIDRVVVERAAARVAAVKAGLGLDAPGAGPRPGPGEGEGLGNLARRVAAAAVRVVSDPGSLLPLRPGTRALVVVPRSSLRGGRSPLASALEPAVRASVCTWETGEAGTVPDADVLILGVVDLHRRAGHARAALDLMAAGPPAVVLALGTPYDSGTLPPGTAYVAVMGQEPCLQLAAAKVLLGQRDI